MRYLGLALICVGLGMFMGKRIATVHLVVANTEGMPPAVKTGTLPVRVCADLLIDGSLPLCMCAASFR